jgi:OmpA-OmpF porin, OOP family
MKRFTTTPVSCAIRAVRAVRAVRGLCAASAALAALALHAPVHAQTHTTPGVTGPYIGAAFGAAFGNREIDDASSSNDEGLGRSAKVYGGYQITPHWGVQAGHVRLRRLNQNTGAGAALVSRSVTGHSTYVAGTGRWPLGASFALTAKAGVAFGKVTAASPSTADAGLLLGSKTSVLIGTGAEVVLNPQVAFTVGLDSYGKLSDRVKGNALTVGTRFMF